MDLERAKIYKTGQMKKNELVREWIRIFPSLQCDLVHFYYVYHKNPVKFKSVKIGCNIYNNNKITRYAYNNT